MKNLNRLINSKSPYLLQHAHNPVDWYEWGLEAFTKAAKENKPIFLSIGYSTCHWCHVMERESFEDQEVADLLNQYYVSIKVDREERPDVDHLYMTVCQAMTGQGGWPLTIVMTPDKKPFFSGTYFSKNDRYGRPGLIQILTKIQQTWEQDKGRADQVSNRVVESVQAYLNPAQEGDLKEDVLDHAYEIFARQFDEMYGGFGDAPKFPRAHDLLFLLRYWKYNGQAEALHVVRKTLDAMRNGGIYDHLGYGFSRYSVDREWLIPHFEKMLYDNALLALAYLEAFQVTNEQQFAEVAEEIFTYILRDMTSPEGGFYSAEDADSEGVEGKFYVWTPQQIRAILGEEDGEIFCTCYTVSTEGNFEKGYNILNQIHICPEEIAKKMDIPLAELNERLQEMRKKLFTVRKRRIHPYKDDKILSSWNGLMIAALARGAKVLEKEKYAKAATKASSFIFDHLMKEDGRLLVRYRDGESAHLGYLDDYAFLTWGLIELYEATFDESFLLKAVHLSREMIRLFGDEVGGFFFYGKDGERLFTRAKEIYDGAIPSGNSVAAYNLIRLAKLTSDEGLVQEAERQLRAFALAVDSSPSAHSFFLMAMQFALKPSKEIVIVGERGDATTEEMIDLVQGAYLPDAVIVFNPAGQLLAKWRLSSENQNRPCVFICENYACQVPITDLEELRERVTIKNQ